MAAPKPRFARSSSSSSSSSCSASCPRPKPCALKSLRSLAVAAAVAAGIDAAAGVDAATGVGTTAATDAGSQQKVEQRQAVASKAGTELKVQVEVVVELVQKNPVLVARLHPGQELMVLDEKPCSCSFGAVRAYVELTASRHVFVTPRVLRLGSTVRLPSKSLVLYVLLECVNFCCHLVCIF